MNGNLWTRRRKEGGQSLVEFALVLPFLMMLFLGIAELGSALYDYLTFTAANREGARLASRGRFDDEAVMERIVSSGDGNVELHTTGSDANFGIIITHFYTNESGAIDPLETTRAFSGTVYVDGTAVPLNSSNVDSYSRIDPNFIIEHDLYQSKVNAYREANDYEVTSVHIVVVETYFAHHLLVPKMAEFLGLHDPISFYLSSTVRVSLDRQQ